MASAQRWQNALPLTIKHHSFPINHLIWPRILDMSKAFDKVWHPGLIFKLKQNGINGKLLDMFEHYLTDRKQRVVLNGIESHWENLLSGVP